MSNGFFLRQYCSGIYTCVEIVFEHVFLFSLNLVDFRESITALFYCTDFFKDEIARLKMEKKNFSLEDKKKKVLRSKMENKLFLSICSIFEKRV